METQRQLQQQQQSGPSPPRPSPDQGRQNSVYRPSPTGNTIYGYQPQNPRDSWPIDARAQGIQPGGEGGKLLRINRAQTAYRAKKEESLQQQQQERLSRGRARGIPPGRRMAAREAQIEPKDPEEQEFEQGVEQVFKELFDLDDEGEPKGTEYNGLPTPNEMTVYMDDPPQNRHPVPYTPEPVTIESLRQDWPAFPIHHPPSSSSSCAEVALSQGISEKLRWLSRRFAHSHNTSMELAQRLFKGELVHFHSAEEQKEVEEFAREMAEERAQELRTRPNGGMGVTEEQPIKVAFRPLAEEEKRELVRGMVKGEYRDDEKNAASAAAPTTTDGASPLMEGIMQNLRNNGTYGRGDTEKFLGKLKEVVGTGTNQGRRLPRAAAA